MGDKEKTNVAITGRFLSYDHLTSKTKLVKALSELLAREDATNRMKVLEAKAVLEEITEDTVQHRYQPKATRVSWTQRVLAWLKRN